MNTRICYYDVIDGETRLHVVSPNQNYFDPNAHPRYKEEISHLGLKSDDEILKWIASKDVPAGKETYFLDASSFPKDRYFRNAWNHDSGKIVIHMDKAKDIHIGKLRDIRAQKFIEMGFPYQLNAQVESAILDDATKVKLKELRDFPQNLDLSKVTDPDVLKSTIPDCLK